MSQREYARLARALRRFWASRSLGATAARVAGCVILLLAVAYGLTWGMIVRMPGRSHRGPLPPLSDAERALAGQLRRDVEMLAGEIGERNVYTPDSLTLAAAYLEAEFQQAGFSVHRQTYKVLRAACHNLIVEVAGADAGDEIIVVGAHYDSVDGCPGANDNASGVAALLGLARRFAGRRCDRTLRFVAFANEEPPWFQTGDMGSLVYAESCRESGDRVLGMISLETIGYYSDQRGSQRYPRPFSLFYPSTGDFIGFVGSLSSARWVRAVIGSFRRHAQFPSQAGAIPLVSQAGWSDHWAFWQCGYPGLMVTDTAPFRYPHYHLPTDTPEKLDYERMARVVMGLDRVLGELAGCR